MCARCAFGNAEQLDTSSIQAPRVAASTVSVMRPSNYIDEPRPKSKDSRRLLRERGTLRCLWCNRRTEIRAGFSWGGIEEEEWRQFVKENEPFYCDRPNCVAHRRECGSSKRQPDDQSRSRRR